MSDTASFFVGVIVITAIVFFILRKKDKNKNAKGMEMICGICGSVGKPRTKTKGSMGIEIILWLCFFIPGLIYSIWRISSRHRICGSCGSPNLLPLNSPMGQKLLKQAKEGADK